jgi:hypothetical protein
VVVALAWLLAVAVPVVQLAAGLVAVPLAAAAVPAA